MTSQTQTNRLHTIDFARGISVLIMIAVHTLWMYGSKETQSESMLGHTIHLLGKGTAAFLVAMGIALFLTPNNTPKLLVKRGFILLALGYGMNILKFILPISAFGTMPETFIQAYGWQSPLTVNQLTYLISTGDILQLAGISLILIAPIISLSLPSWMYLMLVGISASLSYVGPLISSQPYIAKLFFSQDYQIYFAVFPWISAIFAGMFLGKIFVESQLDQSVLFNACLVSGLGFLALSAPLLLSDFSMHFNNFFHLKSGGVLYLIGLNFVALWGIKKLERFWLNTRIYGFIQYCSKHVTSLYVTQWVLICWGMGIVGFSTLSPTHTLAAMPIVAGTVFATHTLYVKVSNKLKKRQPNYTNQVA
ncbi:DUF1624 domain-containing protein [Aestuariibacter sp. AA17]|uniref:DUF1624 domain-containing protein n=1 Tax=Fluctibacter corallii TaxID=2984329 RepID=A0ABT3A6V6_9ALTE|nr:DUF1624 domain-containing protein [Aestuariibacter sp. AA17]MCV2884415.1 DUF1624 domain-containing protein [Aestuariibacter sp. AA17]